MDSRLNGLHIAILVTGGFEQVELTEPKTALEREGAITKIISEKKEDVQGMNHDEPGDRFPVDLRFDETEAADFDALLLPGGHVNAGHIRHILGAQKFVREADEQGKPIAVICHGSWLLVSAGLVQGRTMTSWPSLQQDIRDAGGNWLDQEVVVDGRWVSSRKPDDIPAFNQKMIDVIAQKMHENLRGKSDDRAVGIATS